MIFRSVGFQLRSNGKTAIDCGTNKFIKYRIGRRFVIAFRQFNIGVRIKLRLVWNPRVPNLSLHCAAEFSRTIFYWIFIDLFAFFFFFPHSAVGPAYGWRVKLYALKAVDYYCKAAAARAVGRYVFSMDVYNLKLNLRIRPRGSLYYTPPLCVYIICV